MAQSAIFGADMTPTPALRARPSPEGRDQGLSLARLGEGVSAERLAQALEGGEGLHSLPRLDEDHRNAGEAPFRF